MDKKAKQLTEAELAEKIDRLVLLRPQANEYRQLCDEVKATLQARGSNAFITAASNRAELTHGTGYRWVIERLAKVLTTQIFNVLCPRKPDTKKLNQRLAALPEDKQLAACRVAVPGKVKLSVLAKGETETAAVKLNDDESEEEAA